MRDRILIGLLCVVSCVAPMVQAASFEQWLSQLREEARSEGIAEPVLDAAFQNLKPDERVISRDRRQPEFAQSLDDYLAARVSPARVHEGREMSSRYDTTLALVQARYGVPASVVLAIWGMESGYGRFRGTFSVVRSLATLAWDERRPAFFRRELLAALRIVDAGDVALDAFRGSWAGALGQPQLLPSVYLSHAQDMDGDGRRDIWTSVPDVLASIADVLRSGGWQQGVAWGAAVAVRGTLDGSPKVSRGGCRAWEAHRGPLSPAQWAAQGVQVPESMLDSPEPTTLLSIEDHHYLVTRSFAALLDYNCANAYALAVGLLADGIAAPAARQ